MSTATSRLWLMTGLLALAGCATRGTLPARAGAADIGQQRVEANRAYVEGDMQHAEQLYASIVAVVPNDADAWFRLGNAHFRLQRPDEAVTDYAHVLDIDPGHARALYNMGIVRMKQAQSLMIASGEAGRPGDPLRRDSERMAQRLAKVADDLGSVGRGDGGAPPFIVDDEPPPR